MDLLKVRRKRLLFRCWNRGTQESDLILGSFAEASVAGFDSVQLNRFEALLDCANADLFDWIIGGSEPPRMRHSKGGNKPGEIRPLMQETVLAERG